MSTYNVLLVGDSKGLPDSFPQQLSKHSPHEIISEVMTGIGDALAKLSAQNYDAALCWVEREDELEGVIRIRKARPDLPILVVTSRSDAAFRALARESGATRTTEYLRGLAAIAEHIRLVVATQTLSREFKAQTDRLRGQTREVHRLVTESAGLVSQASELITPVPSFHPILVEDDPDHVLLILYAFKKARMSNPWPIFSSGERLIDHLTECAPEFVSGSRPYPSLIILDFELPGKSGLEVLEWLKQNSQFRRIPVVILSSVEDPAEVHRAYQFGVDKYFIKPLKLDDLVKMVSRLPAYSLRQ